MTITTQNDVLNFLEGRLAYLKSLNILERLPKERREMEKLETVLGPVEGRRKAPDLWKFYEDNYAGRDVFVPTKFLSVDDEEEDRAGQTFLELA